VFDQTDLAEITSPDFSGERLVACKNPFLGAERSRKRESLLAAEADLAKIAAACARARRPLRGQDRPPSARSIPTWTYGRSGAAPRTGPGIRVPADAVVLPQLARAGPARDPAVDRRRQANRPGRPDWPGRPRRPLPACPGQSRHQADPGRLPVHSFSSLLADLGTICLNTIALADPALPSFQLVTTPTALQRQGFELLGVSHRLGVELRIRAADSPMPHPCDIC
jgi:hypothetical protein